MNKIHRNLCPLELILWWDGQKGRVRNISGVLMIRSKEKKSGKGDRIYVGVTTMLIVWSEVGWLSGEKEKQRSAGSVFQAQGTARTDQRPWGRSTLT